MAASYFLSPRSGRKHKAWGVSPREANQYGNKARETGDSLGVTIASLLGSRIMVLETWLLTSAARFAGSLFQSLRSWGFASLHPRLYSLTRSAGYAFSILTRKPLNSGV